MNTNHWRRALLCMAVLVQMATACGDADDTATGAGSVAGEATVTTSVATTAAPATTECVDPDDCSTPGTEPEIVEAPKVTTPEFVDFAAAADQVCATMATKFEALPGIHADDGSVAPGLGALIVETAGALGEVEAPPSVFDTWDQSLAVFAKTGEKFTEAEELRAAGDEQGAEDAVNEALWVLPVEHARLVSSMGVPFAVCFVEE